MEATGSRSGSCSKTWLQFLGLIRGYWKAHWLSSCKSLSFVNLEETDTVCCVSQPGFLVLCCSSSKGFGGLLNSSCTHSHTHSHTHNSPQRHGGWGERLIFQEAFILSCICVYVWRLLRAGVTKEGVFRKILLKSHVDVDSLRSSWREKLTLWHGATVTSWISAQHKAVPTPVIRTSLSSRTWLPPLATPEDTFIMSRRTSVYTEAHYTRHREGDFAHPKNCVNKLIPLFQVSAAERSCAGERWSAVTRRPPLTLIPD